MICNEGKIHGVICLLYFQALTDGWSKWQNCAMSAKAKILRNKTLPLAMKSGKEASAFQTAVE